MNKLENSRTRYYVQWDTHARHMCTVLCSLMEHQSLVDLAICCGTNTIHAHKCVLAANSPYFREQLEKNAGTEQIIVTGLDFAIVKSIIEFMYCGETNILDENLKYMIAAAKFFQMRGLQTLVSDNQDLRYEADSIHIPAPVFLPKKPKYPNAYRPLNNANASPMFDAYKTPVQNDPYVHRKIKRKFVRSEAEKACAKEAAASRLALEALQKELAGTAQMSSFVIEESCTETTVENFIPHTDETSFIDNLNGVPLQMVNYGDLNGSILTDNQMININKSDCANNTMPFGIRTNTTKDKLKRILGNNMSNNIEIMYRTTEGDFVNMTADVLQNLSGDALQYQIVDEHGQIRELREFQNNDQNTNCCSSNYETTECVPALGNSLTQEDISDTKPFINNQNENYMPCSSLEILTSNENSDNSPNFEVLNEKLEDPNTIFPNIINAYAPGGSEQENINTTTNISEPESDIIINDTSISSSQETITNDSLLSDDKIYETDLFADVLNKSKEITDHTEQSATFSRCDVNRYLNLEDVIAQEYKEDKLLKDGIECLTPLKENKRRVGLKKPNILGIRKLRTMTAPNNIDSKLTDQNNQTVSEYEIHDNNTDEKASHDILAHIDLTNDNILDIPLESFEQDAKENDSSDSTIALKKIRLSQNNEPLASNLIIQSVDDDVQILDNVILEAYPSRKTRSSLRTIEDNIYQDNLDEHKEAVEYVAVKNDKPRRIMPNRKKKSN